MSESNTNEERQQQKGKTKLKEQQQKSGTKEKLQMKYEVLSHGEQKMTCGLKTKFERKRVLKCTRIQCESRANKKAEYSNSQIH